MSHCDCGANAGPLGVCADYYHEVLSEEQRDPEMYRWHAVVVCAYLLQHPPGGPDPYLDDQYRLLQFYAGKGLDALTRLQAHRVARNNHRVRAAVDTRPLTPYAPLPATRPAGGFRTTFSDLPFQDGTFLADGHAAYGHRIDAIARATLETYGAPRHGETTKAR
ncbi:hypothetical protein GCM10009733_048560 [Nonomuraea maheshkhaliensis]|uniref:Uncharacterized protein n=1 Tax=Nonomuraea maheshkhaliensis TaxID=419590 RepID=A0ABN2FHR6_9ACTN